MPLRRHGVTRLEGFSDAVFGFALTLLVVSLEVPNNVEELLKDMQGLVGFALMFAMVCWIWYEHNVFFRSYGLQDQWTVFLNCLLLFVVLFYVYPLKFLTAALMRRFFGIGRDGGPAIRGDTDGAPLMLLYSSGVVLIFFVFVLLYRHAWKKRATLELTEKEELSLKFGQRAHLISMGLGLTSVAIVLANGNMAAIAGMIYGLMGPLHAWNGYQSGKAHSEFDKRAQGT
ncbi:MAG TPA: TMEM175 family protein [Vicinamibacterales bacterium]|nr:TMEM175 family protein [Vicinamibacterales bacterium]